VEKRIGKLGGHKKQISINMNIQELRFGNLVISPDGKTLPIDCIQGDGTVRLLDGEKTIGCFSASAIQPIPLTPEILAKVGFKFADYLNTKTRFSKSNFHIDFSKKMWFLHGYRGYPIGMKYLHQLQNLYFALTGTELEINN
jgi:hypothetical protein